MHEGDTKRVKLIICATYAGHEPIEFGDIPKVAID